MNGAAHVVGASGCTCRDPAFLLSPTPQGKQKTGGALPRRSPDTAMGSNTMDLNELREVALTIADQVAKLSDRVSALEARLSADQQESSSPARPPAQ